MKRAYRAGFILFALVLLSPSLLLAQLVDFTSAEFTCRTSAHAGAANEFMEEADAHVYGQGWPHDIDLYSTSSAQDGLYEASAIASLSAKNTLDNLLEIDAYGEVHIDSLGDFSETAGAIAYPTFMNSGALISFIPQVDITLTAQVNSYRTGEYYQRWFSGEEDWGSYELDDQVDIYFYGVQGHFILTGHSSDSIDLPAGELISMRIYASTIGIGYNGSPEGTFDGYSQTYLDIMFTPVPEPATLLLLGLGGFALRRKRRA